jgi:hypothetical protein
VKAVHLVPDLEIDILREQLIALKAAKGLRATA